MKTCCRCKVAKPEEDFYRCAGTKDGRYSSCKDCDKIRRQERWAADPEQRERHRKAAKEREHLPEVAEARLERRRKQVPYAKRYPEKAKAHAALNRAVLSGRVVPWPVCAVPDCTCTEVVAHHAAYSLPLEVVWLCRPHHAQTHALVNHVGRPR